MTWSVTNDDILSVKADAAVLCVENAMVVTDAPACRSLAQAGGENLKTELKKHGFLPVGSAQQADGCGLPYRHLILTAVPRWMNSRGNEFHILERCYTNIYKEAMRLGCNSVVMPFLGGAYYGYPLSELIHIAFTAAESSRIETVFIADSDLLWQKSRETYHRPEITKYIGYYRDHAVFQLDNYMYVRVDLRPEIREYTMIPYIEACYRVGNNPKQRPLPETEIQRLRRIYESGAI